MANYIRFKKNKFNAVRSKCKSGHYHPSKLEAGYCDHLLHLKKNKQIKDYEIQKKFAFAVNSIHICNHYVDFLVHTNSGSIEVHETKGRETDLWRIKHRLFKAIYEDIPYYIVK